MSQAATTSSSVPPPQFNKYKSFFTDLLTWKNLYVSGGSFVGAIVLLYLVKYVNVVQFFFNAAYITLGSAIALEFAGRSIKGGPGFVSSFRSEKYFEISKDVVDPLFSEFTALLNFVLIEIQQIVFVESVPLTVLAFVVSYFTYILVHYVSLWALAFLGTILAFTAPPVYLRFQTQIDEQVAKVSKVVEDKAEDAKAKANEHFGKAIGIAKNYVDQGLDKVGYKRNLPAVPSTESAKPAEPAAEPATIPVATEPVAASE
uniref:Reticulon-like protein n=2 Tax=Lipomyces lipofer TaxID=36043 RepID=A0A6M4AM84_9ASCO|nr:putative reticulon-like protein RtnA [Lipomyces lipofer]